MRCFQNANRTRKESDQEEDPIVGAEFRAVSQSAYENTAQISLASAESNLQLLDLRVLVVSLVAHFVAVEAGNAKVAAQVEDVDGIEVAGDGDEGEAAGCFGQDDCAFDGDAIHDNPHVG